MARRTSHYTTDHETIRRWVEDRGGRPATVKGTGRGHTGILRIDMPGYTGEDSLTPIPWSEFFRKFDAEDLVFAYQDRTARGQKSNFDKFVRLDNDDAGSDAPARPRRTASRATGSRTGASRAAGSRPAGSRPRTRSAGAAREPSRTRSRGADSRASGRSGAREHSDRSHALRASRR
jgi:hypothetical protein